jgi:hypothetical protein
LTAVPTRLIDVKPGRCTVRACPAPHTCNPASVHKPGRCTARPATPSLCTGPAGGPHAPARLPVRIHPALCPCPPALPAHPPWPHSQRLPIQPSARPTRQPHQPPWTIRPARPPTRPQAPPCSAHPLCSTLLALPICAHWQNAYPPNTDPPTLHSSHAHPHPKTHTMCCLPAPATAIGLLFVAAQARRPADDVLLQRW